MEQFQAMHDCTVALCSAVVRWVGSVGDTIAGQPILLLVCVGVPLCGFGVGMFKRLLSARA